MLKDSDGVFHYSDGYLPRDALSDPVFLSPTFCGRDWKNEDGWKIVLFIDPTVYKVIICEECEKERSRKFDIT